MTDEPSLFQTIPARELREAVDRFENGQALATEHLRALVEHARTSIPLTKMIDVWHVETARQTILPGARIIWSPGIAVYPSEAEAAQGAHIANMQSGVACVRVTGPHSHEVPA